MLAAPPVSSNPPCFRLCAFSRPHKTSLIVLVALSILSIIGLKYTPSMTPLFYAEVALLTASIFGIATFLCSRKNPIERGSQPLQIQMGSDDVEAGLGEIRNEQQVLAEYARENIERLKAEERGLRTEGMPTYILRSIPSCFDRCC